MTAGACSQCGTAAHSGDRFCENCGAELAVHQVLVPQLGPAAATCAECGGESFDTDDYCVVCGHLRGAQDRDECELGPIALITDRGLAHPRNEDAGAAGFLDATETGKPPAAIGIVVCDGVSSTDNPQEASGAAARAGVEAMLSALSEGRGAEVAMAAAITAAADAATSVATPDHEHAPSCTFTAAAVLAGSDGRTDITVGNVGDSRVYWLAAEGASEPSQQLTVDDSWAQELISAGVADEAAAMADPRAHMITRWLGADADGDPLPSSAIKTFNTAGPGVLLVCSDGLWNYLPSADDLASIATVGDAMSATRTLVEFAIASGGRDNITVALVPIPPKDTEAA